MEFKSLKTFRRHLVRLGYTSSSLPCSVWALRLMRSMLPTTLLENNEKKIYVLDQGRSLMLALSQDASRNRPVEAREHVRRFHELFFSIAPDKDAY